MSKEFFYQDFIFSEIKVNKKDYPDIVINYTDSIDDCVNINSKRLNDNPVKISFSSLLELEHKKSWDTLIKKLRLAKAVIIIDDLTIVNAELIKYKDFFLKSYYSYIRNNVGKTYVFSQNTA